MPHQCVRCNSFYQDGSDVILKGCSCGAKLFFYVKQDALDEAKKISEGLSSKDKEKIEQDILDLVGADDDNQPVILDLESIRVIKPGKFELDVVRLFDKENPLVYKLDEGKYVIDVPETLSRRLELKSSKSKR
jgi:predicted  nucleic acid-binding Zn-ribbon protein